MVSGPLYFVIVARIWKRDFNTHGYSLDLTFDRVAGCEFVRSELESVRRYGKIYLTLIINTKFLFSL